MRMVLPAIPTTNKWLNVSANVCSTRNNHTSWLKVTLHSTKDTEKHALFALLTLRKWGSKAQCFGGFSCLGHWRTGRYQGPLACLLPLREAYGEAEAQEQELLLELAANGVEALELCFPSFPWIVWFCVLFLRDLSSMIIDLKWLEVRSDLASWFLSLWILQFDFWKAPLVAWPLIALVPGSGAWHGWLGELLPESCQVEGGAVVASEFPARRGG